MRVQYAVICHDFQDGEWEGVTNLGGVRHKLFAPMRLNPDAAPDDPKPPIPIKLVVSLIDGVPGWHNVWVSIRRPSQQPIKKLPSVDIEWDEASPTFFIVMDINFQVFENGIYDFNILVDGDPLGTVPLPVEIVPIPG
jgi:hypothetical protein